jgi:hypothetical protein
MRLIIADKEKGARTKTVGRALHKEITYNSWEGTSLLKFIKGQLYNGKLAKRYGQAPTDECSICHRPDSCTHIVGERPGHEALRISRHNAACQLIHAAIRKTAKGGGALHSAPDLVLIMADAGAQPMTTGEDIQPLSPTPEEHTLHRVPEPPSHDWLAPIPTAKDVSSRIRTDVSQDPRYTILGLSASTSDEECITAPSRLPDWILPQEDTQMLFEAGHGTAPDLIYARGVPDSPDPDPNAFDRKQCSLIVIEIGFCRDFGCVEKLEEKTREVEELKKSVTELRELMDRLARASRN